MKATFEPLLNGEVNQVSIINEPINYEVEFTVKCESALERARRRWRMPQEGEADER